jgi:hypothetical protein
MDFRQAAQCRNCVVLIKRFLRAGYPVGGALDQRLKIYHL